MTCSVSLTTGISDTVLSWLKGSVGGLETAPTASKRALYLLLHTFIRIQDVDGLQEQARIALCTTLVYNVPAERVVTVVVELDKRGLASAKASLCMVPPPGRWQQSTT